MRKILSILLMLFLSFQCACAKSVQAEKVAKINTNIIEDELMSPENFDKLVPVTVRDNGIIEDELINNYEINGDLVKLNTSKYDVINNVIEDELVNDEFARLNKDSDICRGNCSKNMEDEFAQKVIDKTKLKAIKTKIHYDFTKKQIPIKLKISQNFSAKHGAKEGDFLHFSTLADIVINNIKLPKGTSVLGRIETISSSDKMGVPESIVIDNFFVKDKPEINFYGFISKTGANRSIWVYPLYQAGNIMFYVAGFVFVPIHGGHAKFSTDDVYTVYYESK